MIEQIMTRLGVTEMQVTMAYYSGAIPKNIDPEPFIQNWADRIEARTKNTAPKSCISRPKDK